MCLWYILRRVFVGWVLETTGAAARGGEASRGMHMRRNYEFEVGGDVRGSFSLPRRVLWASGTSGREVT
jgi:hypothetical protein